MRGCPLVPIKCLLTKKMVYGTGCGHQLCKIMELLFKFRLMMIMTSVRDINLIRMPAIGKCRKFPQQGFLSSRYITNFAFHAADVEVHFLFSKKNPSFNIPMVTVNLFLMRNVRTVSEYQISNIPLTLPWTHVCSIKDVGQSQNIIDNGQNWQKHSFLWKNRSEISPKQFKPTLFFFYRMSLKQRTG